MIYLIWQKYVRAIELYNKLTTAKEYLQAQTNFIKICIATNK